MRGVRFVHIPTSLLGMCDAAIGGKQGVDLGHLKNYVGVFDQPEMIWIDVRFLETLPERQVKNGMAEVIKHAIIGNSDLLNLLSSPEDQRNTGDWKEIIRNAIEVKKTFVEGDVHEQGVRAALNFGHTIGHAIESCGLANRWHMLHGECIALGMLCETWISHLHLGTPDKSGCDGIFELILHQTPVKPPKTIDLEELTPYLVKDKKGSQGIMHFTLINGIGKPEVGCRITMDDLRKYLKMNDLPEQMTWLSL
jgi:3-dehydroquinate synthase